jgi:PAS domain S-box-containing protein
LGAVGVIGWLTGLTWLTVIVPGQPQMKANTALALLLVGIAGALRRKQHAGRSRTALANCAALIVFAVGAETLAEYALQIDLHIDQLLAPSSGGPYPGRPSPPTAFALASLGAALLVFDLRVGGHFRPSEWLALCAAFTAFVSLVGIVLGVGPLYRLPGTAAVTGVAVPTAVGLLLASAGLLLLRPEAGVMRLVTSPGWGGVVLRRLALPPIAGAVLLGLAATWVSRLLDIEQQASFIITILSAATAVVALLLLAATAVPLDRAHAALEASRGRIRELVAQAPDGIFVADLDGRYTEVNDAGCRMLGLAREQVIGKTIMDLIPQHDVPRLLASKAQMLAGASHVAEWSLRRADGSFLPVEVSARILGDGRWQGFVRDISERKRAEDALRASEARLSGVISIAGDAIISVDDQSRIVIFNEVAARTFGWQAEQILGQPLDVLIPERFRAAHRQHVRGFSQDPAATRQVGGRAGIFGLRKSGEEFPAEAAISKLALGGRLLFTVVLRDITERVRVGNEQRLFAEFSAALGASLDLDETLAGIARLSVRNFTDCCVVDLSPGEGDGKRLLCLLSGGARTDTCRTLETLWSERPGPVARVMATQQPLLASEASEEFLRALAQEPRHLDALRELGPASCMIVPMVTRGRVLGTLTFLSARGSRRHDAQDLHFAERLADRAAVAVDNARLYEAARRAIRARDEVLGVVAHDLRNPLSAILIASELLHDRGGQREPPGARAAEAIHRAAGRMQRLIQDLLDVTRIESGTLSVEGARIDLAQIVAESVEAQSSLAASADLELRVELARDLPEVWGDRDRLLQVLENLLGNAIKFTGPGGRISVGASARTGEALVWVSDTGPGIAEEDLPHVFDRFWQTRRTGRAGAGLGLPIVKGIVEAHRGRVWIESGLGRGSTFLFTLPTAPPASDARHEPAPHGA